MTRKSLRSGTAQDLGEFVWLYVRELLTAIF